MIEQEVQTGHGSLAAARCGAGHTNKHVHHLRVLGNTAEQVQAQSDSVEWEAIGDREVQTHPRYVTFTTLQRQQ
jgi:hypothetical protein